MAVKTSWVAGEVLTAADLTDTFGSKLPYAFGTATPSTTVEGFVWYDENDTPPTPKFWDGSAFQTLAPAPGLELITAETFSAVSSVSINGCFTASYSNYEIVAMMTASGAVSISSRLRASGSDDSGSNYTRQRLYASSTSVTSSIVSSQTAFFHTDLNTGKHLLRFLIGDPAAASPTRLHFFGHSSNTDLQTSVAQHSQSTAYDGITFFPTSGTISGTIRIYGYKD